MVANDFDRKSLFELDTPSLTLDLRVDDNRPREITGRAVNMNNGKPEAENKYE